MNATLLTLDVWDTLTSAEREATAHSVAELLPSPFRFKGLATHSQGYQTHEIAFFDWNGVDFALIPGGVVTLGYDRSTPFVPTEAQQEEWTEIAEEYGLPSIEQYISDALTPLRQTILAPYLLEVEPIELGIKRLSLSDPAVAQQSKQKLSPGWTMTSYSGGRAIRYTVDQAGRIEAFEETRVTHEATLRQVYAEGFRLPTSDEWEHACSAGARTLFRWGDNCPSDCYPFDTVSRDEWKQQASSYTGRNAFGLHIAVYPYHWEYCDEPGIMRGGDGGGAICGGMGYFAGWLPLASAYEAIVKEPYRAYLRRAFSVQTQMEMAQENG